MAKQSLNSYRFSMLQKHLKQENPLLGDVLGMFSKLDRIGKRTGFLEKGDSFALSTSWWPLISVLGTYSSGKSSFINYYLETDLQNTGNQAVDDKFTVVCYSRDKKVQNLPGQALDSDPRFPLYNIGQSIEEAAPGESRKVDNFLQLKTCNSDKLKGRILVDSPGFDADAQRDATLRITDRIMDLSDLVLVFFDARHPETGSMRDTLKHLVQDTVQRSDSNKFMYILNQVDVTAKEDNPEEVFAAWQRSLAQHGLIAGRYYSIYNPKVAGPILDETLRQRYEKKCLSDLNRIFERVDQVKIDRVYRIVGLLESATKMLHQDVVPLVSGFLRTLRKQLLIVETALLLLVLALVWGVLARFTEISFVHVLLAFPKNLITDFTWQAGTLAGLLLAGWGHFSLRRKLGQRLQHKTLEKIREQKYKEGCARAMRKNLSWFRCLWRRRPVGWSGRAEKNAALILEEVDTFIQKLNDMYTDPSGEKGETRVSEEEQTPANPKST